MSRHECARARAPVCECFLTCFPRTVWYISRLDCKSPFELCIQNTDLDDFLFLISSQYLFRLPVVGAVVRYHYYCRSNCNSFPIPLPFPLAFLLSCSFLVLVNLLLFLVVHTFNFRIHFFKYTYSTFLLLFVLIYSISPWYNHPSWLGVKKKKLHTLIWLKQGSGSLPLGRCSVLCLSIVSLII